MMIIKIYDDISNQFTGIGRTFNLTVGGSNTTGIGTDGGSGLVFVNNIYQSPKTDNNPTIFNYEISEGVRNNNYRIFWNNQTR